MRERTVEHHLLAPAGGSPNNPSLPLILYRAALEVGDKDPESAIEKTFGANRWGDGFRGDTFPFHHYHSVAHEVVGIARGRARIQFGGPSGPVFDVEAGDAVLIPAGVAHRRLDDTPGFSSVGAYPPGQQPDLCVLSEADQRAAQARPDVGGLDIEAVGEDALQAARERVRQTALPETDPIMGVAGPVAEIWLKR